MLRAREAEVDANLIQDAEAALQAAGPEPIHGLGSSALEIGSVRWSWRTSESSRRMVRNGGRRKQSSKLPLALGTWCFWKLPSQKRGL